MCGRGSWWSGLDNRLAEKFSVVVGVSIRTTTVLARIEAEVWSDDLHEHAALALVIRTGKDKVPQVPTDNSGRGLLCRTSPLRNANAVGELVRAAPPARRSEILLAQRRLRHGCADRSS